MSAALDRLKKAIAAAGPGPLALVSATAADVAAVLGAIPPDVLAVPIVPNPTGERHEFVPADLLAGVKRCNPAATVHQYARQVEAALALLPS